MGGRWLALDGPWPGHPRRQSRRRREFGGLISKNDVLLPISRARTRAYVPARGRRIDIQKVLGVGWGGPECVGMSAVGMRD